MASYTITGCTVADGAELSRNNMSAFWEDPHFILAWPHRTLDQHIAEQAKRIPLNLLDDNRTIKRHQKAIDLETRRLLGYARWRIPPSRATKEDGTLEWPEAIVPAVGPEEEAEIRRVAEAAVFDPNQESDELLVEVNEIRNEILTRKDYMRLDYLAVHPENKRQGVATALIQSGMKVAENLGLDIYIQATKAGLGAYKRCGFRIERELTQDDSKYGGTGEVSTYFMIYEQKLRPNAP
ncbi:hypothetical protein BKA67DRAFT_572422 [Truncatella angustata]|uniref:N-acetyltransferase domain-containing protein n=1 Tax=Truncatella angustata TaxID=152316 RepID=A0A9P8UGR3_9PEZI|nr:uncharacterized protein BKA67DRAFT_572422 [Truncatella angustata]KAH6651924.1 hypothetical protein BKA67DRAFT_572422 [Truncatella angustata]KAH8205653.1 hypothetical protein TruAng_000147 [Truncatella angustata]